MSDNYRAKHARRYRVAHDADHRTSIYRPQHRRIVPRVYVYDTDGHLVTVPITDIETHR